MKTIWRTRCIPVIRLRHFSCPKKGEYIWNELQCDQCGAVNIRTGSGGTDKKTGEQYVICENCAIENYKTEFKFKDRRCAAAHRRRLFDVQYLYTELVIDHFCSVFDFQSIDDLDDVTWERLIHAGRDGYNIGVPKRKKIQLQDTESQKDIEKYLQKKIWIGMASMLRSGEDGTEGDDG